MICIMWALNINWDPFSMFWCSRLQSFHFAAYLLMIQRWKLHAFPPFLPLSLLIPSCTSKELSIFSSAQSCSPDLPGRLKVEFKSCVSGNVMFSPAFSCLLALFLSLCFRGCNYSPAMFLAELNFWWTLRPPLWTCFIFDGKEKPFVILCCFRFIFSFTSCFSNGIYPCRGQHFPPRPIIRWCRLPGCCSSLWKTTQGNPPTFEWLRLKLLMRCFYI